VPVHRCATKHGGREAARQRLRPRVRQCAQDIQVDALSAAIAAVASSRCRTWASLCELREGQHEYDPKGRAENGHAGSRSARRGGRRDREQFSTAVVRRSAVRQHVQVSDPRPSALGQTPKNIRSARHCEVLTPATQISDRGRLRCPIQRIIATASGRARVTAGGSVLRGGGRLGQSCVKLAAGMRRVDSVL